MGKDFCRTLEYTEQPEGFGCFPGAPRPQLERSGAWVARGKRRQWRQRAAQGLLGRAGGWRMSTLGLAVRSACGSALCSLFRAWHGWQGCGPQGGTQGTGVLKAASGDTTTWSYRGPIGAPTLASFHDCSYLPLASSDFCWV